MAERDRRLARPMRDLEEILEHIGPHDAPQKNQAVSACRHCRCRCC